MSELSLRYKPDFLRAQDYWDVFWLHEIIDRPCAIVWAKTKPDATIHPNLQPVEGNFNESFSKYDEFLESHVFLGECIPGFRPGFGPDQMAGFLGAPIVISPDSDNTSWAEKIVERWEDFLPLKIDEQNRTWNRMKDFHQQAEKRYEGKCLLYNIDMHSNIDALEALRGAQKLLFDMIDQPEIILEAMAQIRVLYKEVFEQFNGYGNKKMIGSNSAMHLYSRGTTDYIQADFICLLSPEMLHKFVLPAIEEEARYLENSCFHLDGPDALKHLDDILAIEKIDTVQWLPGAGNKPGYQWPEVIDKIQSAKKSAVLYGTVEEIKAIHGRYKPNLLVYDVTAESREEGLEFLEWLKKHT